MGVRLFLPLPGPFVAVSKSRAEKIIERRDREQRLAEYAASLTEEQAWRRGAAIVIGFWAFLAYVFAFYGAWTLAIGIAGVGLLHFKSGFDKEQQRRAAVAQAQADEHELAAGTGEY